jgi:hypothetical protein
MRNICFAPPVKAGGDWSGRRREPVFRSETPGAGPVALRRATLSYQSQSDESTVALAAARSLADVLSAPRWLCGQIVCSESDANVALRQRGSGGGVPPASPPAAGLEPGLASDLTGSPGCQFGRVLSPTLGPGRRWSTSIERSTAARSLPADPCLAIRARVPRSPSPRRPPAKPPESPQIAGRRFGRAVSVSPPASIFVCRWQRTPRS